MQAGGGPTGTELAAELNDLVSFCFLRMQMAMPHVKLKMIVVHCKRWPQAAIPKIIRATASL